MPVFRFPDLIDPVADALPYLANTNRHVETLVQKGTEFLCQLSGTCRSNINVLGHARLIHISIDCLCVIEKGIVPAKQEFQHRIVDQCQRMWLAHGELPERQRTVPEHGVPSFSSSGVINNYSGSDVKDA